MASVGHFEDYEVSLNYMLDTEVVRQHNYCIYAQVKPSVLEIAMDQKARRDVKNIFSPSFINFSEKAESLGCSNLTLSHGTEVEV